MKCISPCYDIDYYILNILGSENILDLLFVNKYYYNLIINEEIYKEFLEFYKCKDKKFNEIKRGLMHKIDYISLGKNLIHQNFVIACAMGSLHVAKYIYNKHEINIHYNNELSFAMACAFDRLNIVKWLLKIPHDSPSTIFSYPIDIHIQDNLIFKICLGNKGNYKTSKYLLKIDKSNKFKKCFVGNKLAENVANINLVMLVAIRNNDFKLFEWIMNIVKNKDLEIDTTYEKLCFDVFYYSWLENNIKTMKYLLKNEIWIIKKIKKDEKIGEIFIELCCKKQIEMVKLLLSVIIDSTTGLFKINEHHELRHDTFSIYNNDTLHDKFTPYDINLQQQSFFVVRDENYIIKNDKEFDGLICDLDSDIDTDFDIEHDNHDDHDDHTKKSIKYNLEFPYILKTHHNMDNAIEFLLDNDLLKFCSLDILDIKKYFEKLCEKNNLKKAQQLYEYCVKYNIKIEITESLFIKYIKDELFDIALWLFSLNPSLNLSDDLIEDMYNKGNILEAKKLIQKLFY